MAFRTYDRIDAPEAEQAMDLYRQAFPEPGRKPDRIIAGMLARKLGFLHAEDEAGEVTAMAVTGPVPEANLLLIDYLAVRADKRKSGVGRRFVRDLTRWARDDLRLSGLLLEAEADPGPENAGRIAFWERCGFRLTEYVHHYIWVPETYRAMYLPFDSRLQVRDDGKSLFRNIEAFHRKAYRGQ